MKATGIVRRIDDLGRVVIPKEIRRTMRIREGDPLEIYTERDGEVIFKKYSPIGELSQFAACYCETLSKVSLYAVAICDRDSIIAVSGVPKKDIFERRVSQELEHLMEARQYFSADKDREKCPPVCAENEKYRCSLAVPIIADGDVIGAVIFIAIRPDQIPGEVESKLAQSAASFLGKNMEG